MTAEQQTKQEAMLLAEELKRRNQVLEEETIAQRHIIHLEKIKTEKESKELEEQRNQLMMDLEQEKQRLEEDIDKLHRNKVSSKTLINSCAVTVLSPSLRVCVSVVSLPHPASLCWLVGSPQVRSPASTRAHNWCVSP